jgi:hypothetical protein
MVDGDGCSSLCEPETTSNGVCNAITVSGVYYVGSGPDTISLCNIGLATSFNTGTHAWSWSCNGFSGGNSVSCSAIEQRCGDGKTNGTEVCDGQS